MEQKPQPTNLQELWDQLNVFDWFFDFSDDHRVWTNGCAEQNRLIRAAAAIEGGDGMRQAFAKHHFSGKSWNTEKAPKPERPS